MEETLQAAAASLSFSVLSESTLASHYSCGMVFNIKTKALSFSQLSW